MIVVVLARDILACFGKSPEHNCAFYEFMMYRNVQQQGDSRQKFWLFIHMLLVVRVLMLLGLWHDSENIPAI